MSHQSINDGLINEWIDFIVRLINMFLRRPKKQGEYKMTTELLTPFLTESYYGLTNIK